MTATRERGRGLRVVAAAAALAAAAVLPAFAEKPAFDRYRTILDRQMFGPLPDDFDPTKLPSEVSRSSSAASGRAAEQLTKEQEKLKSAVRFSVINMTPQGDVAVGFTDSSEAKSPRHYYLRVGETRDGWLVKEADPETATMTVAKGEIEVTLSIGQDSAKADAKGDAAKGAAAKVGGPRRSPLLGTLGGRRRQREAQAAQVAAMSEQLRQEVNAFREEREQANREQAEREAQEKAELDANRDADKKSLQSVREELNRVRAQLTAQKKDDDENAEGSGDANDDAE